MTVPSPWTAIAVPSIVVSDDELGLTEYHLRQLDRFQRANRLHESYYEGSEILRQLGVSVPPELQDLETVVGWPGTVVDVLDERLDWLGWATPDSGDPFGLEQVFLDNALDLESDHAHLDTLIYGTAFVIVGPGGAGEPNPLVTVESPKRVTGIWDTRMRRLSSALSVDLTDPDGRPSMVTLYLPDQNVILSRSGSMWRVEDRLMHRIGRVPVAQLVNRPRAGNPYGRSEITRPIRAYTDAAARTLLGMEVHREFYQAPQRWVLGVDADAYTSSDGQVRTGWEAVMGRMLALPRDDNDELPQVGQFEQTSPQPYLEQVRGLGELIAGEAGIPSSYLGFYTANPTSADAIRAAESRLIKRSERRQTAYSRTWREVGALALLVRDGQLPEDYRYVSASWRDPATPTRSAAADEAVKLVGSGILPPDSTVTYDRIGLSPADQRRLIEDKRRAQAQATVEALTNVPPVPVAGEAPTVPPVPPGQPAQ